jgi:hypothetical protein
MKGEYKPKTRSEINYFKRSYNTNAERINRIRKSLKHVKPVSNKYLPRISVLNKLIKQSNTNNKKKNTKSKNLNNKKYISESNKYKLNKFPKNPSNKTRILFALSKNNNIEINPNDLNIYLFPDKSGHKMMSLSFNLNIKENKTHSPKIMQSIMNNNLLQQIPMDYNTRTSFSGLIEQNIDNKTDNKTKEDNVQVNKEINTNKYNNYHNINNKKPLLKTNKIHNIPPTKNNEWKSVQNIKKPEYHPEFENIKPKKSFFSKFNPFSKK